MVSCVAKRNVRVSPIYADDPLWVNKIPVTKKDILVTEGDLIRKYTPFAKITVDSVGSSKEHSFGRMREEAAKIGADAVIKVSVSNQYEGQDVNLFSGQDLVRVQVCNLNLIVLCIT